MISETLNQLFRTISSISKVRYLLALGVLLSAVGINYFSYLSFFDVRIIQFADSASVAKHTLILTLALSACFLVSRIASRIVARASRALSLVMIATIEVMVRPFLLKNTITLNAITDIRQKYLNYRFEVFCEYILCGLFTAIGFLALYIGRYTAEYLYASLFWSIVYIYILALLTILIKLLSSTLDFRIDKNNTLQEKVSEAKNELTKTLFNSFLISLGVLIVANAAFLGSYRALYISRNYVTVPAQTSTSQRYTIVIESSHALTMYDIDRNEIVYQADRSGKLFRFEGKPYQIRLRISYPRRGIQDIAFFKQVFETVKGTIKKILVNKVFLNIPLVQSSD